MSENNVVKFPENEKAENVVDVSGVNEFQARVNAMLSAGKYFICDSTGAVMVDGLPPMHVYKLAGAVQASAIPQIVKETLAAMAFAEQNKNNPNATTEETPE